MLTLSLLLDWCRVLFEYAKIKQVKQSGLWQQGLNTKLYSTSRCEIKKFHPIRTRVSHHLWILIFYYKSFLTWSYNSLYSPKVLVFSPNARSFFPIFNSLWVQASRTDLSVLAQAFHTRSYKTYIQKTFWLSQYKCKFLVRKWNIYGIFVKHAHRKLTCFCFFSVV